MLNVGGEANNINEIKQEFPTNSVIVMGTMVDQALKMTLCKFQMSRLQDQELRR